VVAALMFGCRFAIELKMELRELIAPELGVLISPYAFVVSGLTPFIFPACEVPYAEAPASRVPAIKVAAPIPIPMVQPIF
jgi:hypothetical protein